MEHAYLRVALERTLGLNVTRGKSIACLPLSGEILAPQANMVGAFNASLSQIVKRFTPPQTFDEQEETIQVCDIAVAPNGEFIAVGYSNAEIVVFDRDGEVANHFIGHRRAVTSLQFSEDSNLLASGSQDNDVIIWDAPGDSGVCRLTGHQNAVTDLCFVPGTKWLVSSSKDTHIRVWDIDLQTCIQTVTTTASEVWGLCWISSMRQIVSVGRSSEFFVWKVADPEEIDQSSPVVLSLELKETRQCQHRASQVIVNKENTVMAICNAGRSIEFWRVNDEKVMEKKRKRRMKRRKADTAEEAPTVTSNVEFEHVYTHAMEDKVVAMLFVGKSLYVATANNTISRLVKSKEDESYSVVDATSGHRNDIRCVAMTDDQIVSAGKGACKVWDFESGKCVSSVECGDASAMTVLVGGRFAILGTTDGILEFIDLVTAEVYHRMRGHQKRIWQIAVTHDFTEVATGSEDCEVRFWNFRFEEERPILVHKRTLQMTDEVYAVAYNSDSTLVAVALLDSNVHVFFTDTLNSHLVLYGAHLPITCIDFSSDKSLIVTGSADKNMYIWGAEFGDRHRSLWQHTSVISGCKFEQGTHMAWTIGRDGLVNYWDCDRFMCVQKLRSHIAEVWALALSKTNEFIITAGRDKGIRIWKHTKESLYISLEEEVRLQRRMDKEGAEKADRTVNALRNSVFGGAVVDSAARQSVESITHGDLLADAIAAADNERDGEGGNPLMRDITPAQYVMRTLQRINRANLDIVMASLPFHSAVSLIRWMVEWLREGREVELTVRCLCCLIKHHRNQLESSSTVRPLFLEARDLVHAKVDDLRDRCGMNLAALRLISREMKNM